MNGIDSNDSGVIGNDGKTYLVGVKGSFISANYVISTSYGLTIGFAYLIVSLGLKLSQASKFSLKTGSLISIEKLDGLVLHFS